MVGELTELTGAPATGKTQVGGWLVAYLTVPTVHIVTCGGYTCTCVHFIPLSQLCHSLAAAVAMKTSSTVLWVDSTGAFSPFRLRDNLVRGGAREEVIMGGNYGG